MNLKVRDNLLMLGMHALNKMGRLKVTGLSEIDIHKSNGILIVATTALGDAIFCTPLFEALRKALPGKKIGFLVHRSFQDIFLDDDNLNVVIPYYGKFNKVYSTVRRLKAEAFDIALVANMNDPDVIPLLYWSGIRTIIRRPWKSTIYNYLISNPKMMGKGQPPDHAIPLNLKMAEIVGLKTDNERTYIKLNKESQERISGLLHDKGVGEGALLIGFHPGASLTSKMWPPEGYAELGKKIVTDYPGSMIVLTGSKKEAPICREIERQIGARAFNSAGKLSLPEVAALFQRLILFVSGDTGPFHIANALGIKTVTIFGPSDEKTNGPFWDLDIHRVIKNSLECYYDNCGRWCKKPECIQRISVTAVYNECRSLLDAGRANS
jgi:ADP-heptose:LPS heptosyltransferase